MKSFVDPAIVTAENTREIMRDDGFHSVLVRGGKEGRSLLTLR